MPVSEATRWSLRYPWLTQVSRENGNTIQIGITGQDERTDERAAERMVLGPAVALEEHRSISARVGDHSAGRRATGGKSLRLTGKEVGLAVTVHITTLRDNTAEMSILLLTVYAREDRAVGP